MRTCIMGLILSSSVCRSWGRGWSVLAVACHITATAPSEPCCHVVSSLLFFIHWLDQFMEPVAEYFPLSFLVWPELSICIHQTVPTLPLLPVVTPRRHGDSSHSDKHHNTSASTTNTPSTTTLICPPKHLKLKNESTSSHLNKIYHSITAPEATTKHWHWSLNLT